MAVKIVYVGLGAAEDRSDASESNRRRFGTRRRGGGVPGNRNLSRYLFVLVVGIIHVEFGERAQVVRIHITTNYHALHRDNWVDGDWLSGRITGRGGQHGWRDGSIDRYSGFSAGMAGAWETAAGAFETVAGAFEMVAGAMETCLSSWRLGWR